MIEVIDTGNDAIVGFKVDGTVNDKDIRRISGAIDRALAHNTEVGMVADVQDFGDMTLKGLVADIRHSLKRVQDMDRFTRVAIVGDEDWVSQAEKFGTLIPGLDVKTFAAEDGVRARSWVGEA